MDREGQAKMTCNMTIEEAIEIGLNMIAQNVIEGVTFTEKDIQEYIKSFRWKK